MEAVQALRYSSAFECSNCHRAYREPEPRLFSFNNPFGACPRCQGFGNTIDFDPNLIIPNQARTLDGGAIDPWTKPKGREWFRDFRKQAAGRVRFDVPFAQLTQEEQRLVLEGEAIEQKDTADAAAPGAVQRA